MDVNVLYGQNCRAIDKIKYSENYKDMIEEFFNRTSDIVKYNSDIKYPDIIIKTGIPFKSTGRNGESIIEVPGIIIDINNRLIKNISELVNIDKLGSLEITFGLITQLYDWDDGLYDLHFFLNELIDLVECYSIEKISTLEKQCYNKMMEEAVDCDDHERMDEILMELVNRAGLKDVVDIFDNAIKQYFCND